MRAFPFTIVFLIPFTAFLGVFLGSYYTFLTPVLVFVLVPLFDKLIGENRSNPSEDEASVLEKDWRFRIIPMICSFAQVAVVIAYIAILTLQSLTTLEKIGFTVSVGISSGVMGINVAHELVHRVKTQLEPILGQMMLLTALYMPWGLEHVVGHHRRVATPEDPATARYNEIIYVFIFRSIFGGLISAWKFAQLKAKKKGKTPLFLFNKVNWFLFLEGIQILLIGLLTRWEIALFFILQAGVAIFLLESVNYIEHYGLVRSRRADGRYEKVQPQHSWNSSFQLTNWFLFNLQRHSDHHYKAGRRYQVLRHQAESLQLPAGYATMILTALIPPLFFKVINPLIPPEEISNEK